MSETNNAKTEMNAVKVPKKRKPTAKQVIDPNAPKCLVPDCGRPQQTRGLCIGCYAVARTAVKEGATTWDVLQAKGRALPRGGASGTRKSRAKAWLLAE